MDEYDVGITVPSSDKRSDIITINGPRKNCEEARQALERRRQELEAEKEEKVSVCVRSEGCGGESEGVGVCVVGLVLLRAFI